MNRVDALLRKVEKKWMCMNPRRRRRLMLWICLAIVVSWISWESWQTRQYRHAIRDLNMHNRELRQQIYAVARQMSQLEN